MQYKLLVDLFSWSQLWLFLHPFGIKIRLHIADKEYINPFPHNDTFWRPWETSLLKTLGKGEIARKEQFLLFPVFSTRLDNFLSFS